ncbi:MAG: hypothetical protein ACHQNA_01180 [Acidimicrobiales bacterium]
MVKNSSEAEHLEALRLLREEAGVDLPGPATARATGRRLSERANRGERATLAIPSLKCRGRCRRRIAKLLTAPRPDEQTPDGYIESSRFNTGPELSLFGPFANGVAAEFHLRGRESPAAPEVHLSLRGRTEPIVIVCSCGYRNVLDPVVLTRTAQARTI